MLTEFHFKKPFLEKIFQKLFTGLYSMVCLCGYKKNEIGNKHQKKKEEEAEKKPGEH